MDLGFLAAGYRIVWANDFDSDAQQVYSTNIGRIDPRDIRDVDEDEVPDCDIITAGFPCQPFSNAGNRRGVKDRRGTLYEECLRIVKAKKPSVVVFENVRGILSIRDHTGTKLMDQICRSLEIEISPGYNVDYRLIKASDYGVPQNRYRVFLVAIRKDYARTFTFPEPITCDKKTLALGNVLNSIPKDAKNQIDWPLSPQALYMAERIPEGGSWKSIPYDQLPERFQRIHRQMKKYRSPNFYRRFSRNEIIGTITASAQPENCGILHPVENRRLNIREIATIQTFPHDFLFNESKISGMYKVIGNAVPPLLAQIIAEEILLQVPELVKRDLETCQRWAI
ncbi:MAG: DNA cytosine methyltransferase [Firmicutes bacterium]|nr:DNA cytosine methyltransferase [Bacillota bacterium]